MSGWQDHANCRGLDPDLFYAGRGENDDSDAAKAICADCPVRGECLDHALTTHQAHGVWGGLTTLERKHIRRANRAGAA
jgi:WhiB family redox-sensing transcriptional regulator